MKNYIYILLIAILAIGACKKEPYVDYQAIALEQYGKDTVIINKYIVDNDIPAVKDSTMDIYYQIIEPGTGDVVPNDYSMITIDYTGKLLNGTTFDQGTAAKFQLGSLIAGWRLGVPKIRKGGKIRLIIPSGFGYGGSASGKIPANSILDFEIELKEIQ
ncbi:FKBP-type peptidyl-prolyl cis-trans isomerase [Pedobacter arcticus]|uniref:FKBP-type peptidyl-prolyl cis-trans isomerase n=1 Tax=Pedobacter arcticus TaxID=752140 RepID=UPI0004751D84|nr:FKBP-type peptidyl-prolyl cis-trans isomerase [Pedobacter arcticus]